MSMKTLAMALLMLPTPGFAQNEAICPYIGILAETVMEQRQAGIPMSTVLAVASTVDSVFVQEAVRELAAMAYDLPRSLSAEYRTIAVQDFRIMAEATCYEAAR